MKITWGQTLRVWWSIFWRNFLAALALGFVGGLAFGMLAAVIHGTGPAGAHPPHVGLLLTGGLIALALFAALITAVFMVIQLALKANALLIDPRTDAVPFGTAFRVWWGMTWRGVLYGIGLGLAMLPLVLMAKNAPIALAMVQLLQFVLGLAVGFLALKQTLQANVDKAAESPIYVS